MSVTMQRVSADSKDSVKFLRKVARDNAGFGVEWTLYAGESSEWRISFYRKVKGTLGEPDEEITVETDFKVSMPPDREFGEKRAFSDSEPVMVVRPISVHLSLGSVAIAAKLLADGGRLSVEASSGSTSSSRHGISIYTLAATMPGIPYARVDVGGATLAVNGRCVCSGAVSLR